MIRVEQFPLPNTGDKFPTCQALDEGLIPGSPTDEIIATSAAMDRVRRIISARVAELDISQAEAARRCGLERTFIRDILNGRKDAIRGSNLAKMSQGLGIPLGSLIAIEDLPHTPPAEPKAQRPTAIVWVPEIDVKEPLREGELMAAKGPARGEWGLPAYFLDQMGVRGSSVCICAVKGPSMAPDLNSDDRVIVDLSDRNVAEDGIFAVYDAETASILIKNVSPIRGTNPPRVLCQSSNPKYPPIEIELANGSHVIGRVRQRITAV